jgi:hypothetical protein
LKDHLPAKDDLIIVLSVLVILQLVSKTNLYCDLIGISIVQSQSDGAPETSVFSCGAKMMVRGTVASKAYATGKTVVADAVQVGLCVLCSYAISYIRNRKITANINFDLIFDIRTNWDF